MVHRFHTEIAKMYGVTAAVIFFNIAYWVGENEKIRFIIMTVTIGCIAAYTIWLNRHMII